MNDLIPNYDRQLDGRHQSHLDDRVSAPFGVDTGVENATEEEEMNDSNDEENSTVPFSEPNSAIIVDSNAGWEWVYATLKAPDGRVVLTAKSLKVEDAQHILDALDAERRSAARIKALEATLRALQLCEVNQCHTCAEVVREALNTRGASQ